MFEIETFQIEIVEKQSPAVRLNMGPYRNPPTSAKLNKVGV